MVPTGERFEVVVVGGGPGGYAAALYGVAAGLDVALVEKDKVGGTCLHRGCIPAKELLETASVYRTVGAAKEFGVDSGGQPTVDFGVTQARKRGVVDDVHKGLSGLLSRRKETVYDGVGTLHPGRTVRVSGGASGDVELTGGAVIIATGSVPRTIPGFEIDGEVVVTSDELLELERLPSSAAVIGAGAIGCEFASMMSDLGTQVTLLEALPKMLPGCDDDVARVVQRSFTKRGIDVRTGVQVTGHERSGDGTVVTLAEGEPVPVELVVVSVGRRPLSDGLGLDGTGVAVDERGFVQVDERCRTAADGVYAVGDVTDTPQLAHVGYAEAMVAVRDILGEPAVPVDYQAVPWCIYCHPEVAFAGHSEASAVEAGYEVVTSKVRFGASARARIIGDTDGMVKIVAERTADGEAGQILGVHMVGPWVTEQLGQGYLSVNWGATVEEVAAFVQPHPTLSELFGEAVQSLTGRSLNV